MGGFGHRNGTSRTWLHNQWARELAAFYRAVGVVYRHEPKDLVEEKQARYAAARAAQPDPEPEPDPPPRYVQPDFYGLHVGSAVPTLVDVAVVSPFRGRTVARTEAHKRDVYAASLWASEDPQPLVVPFVGSTLGVVGPSAWQHVDALLEAASEAQRGQFRRRAEDGADRATYWRRRLSVGLSRWVADMIGRRLEVAEQCAATGHTVHNRAHSVETPAAAAARLLPLEVGGGAAGLRPSESDDVQGEEDWFEVGGQGGGGASEWG